MNRASSIPRLRRWMRWGIALLLLPVLWLAAVAVSVILASRSSDMLPADAAIVMGAAVVRDRPTPVFEQRIRHGVNLYRAGQVKKLILTGGIGYGDTRAESEVARDMCLAEGVPAGDILVETASRTTLHNLAHARRLLVTNRLERALIVSDPLHMKRALTQARDLGIDAHPSPTPTTRYVGGWSRVRFTARETWYLARYLVYRLLIGDAIDEARAIARG